MIVVLARGQVGVIVDGGNTTRVTTRGFMDHLFGIDENEKPYMDLSWNHITHPNSRHNNTLNLTSLSGVQLYKDKTNYYAFRNGRDKDDTYDTCSHNVLWNKSTTRVMQLGVHEPTLMAYLNNLIIENLKTKLISFRVKLLCFN